MVVFDGYSRRNLVSSKASWFCIKLVVLSGFCLFQIVVSTTESSVYDEDSYDYISKDDDLSICTKETYNRTCCNKDEFQCGNGYCISENNVCDSSAVSSHYWNIPWLNDKEHCSDGTDEIGCSVDTCKQMNSTCEQLCLDLPGNKSRCHCYKGYTLKRVDSVPKCLDIDECLIGVHSCSHECVNLNGTFRCTCKNGFHGENGSCQAEDRNIWILYNSDKSIFYHNVENGIKVVVVHHAGNVQEIVFDPLTDIMYWWSQDHLARSFLPGAKDGYVTIGHPQPLGENIFHDITRNSLAIDWTAGNLYWLSTDILNNTNSNIMVSKLDSRYIKTLIEVPHASSLVVDPEYGKMYWTAGGNEPYIGMAWMNGMFKWKVVSLTNQLPIALALDHLSDGRLYWVDSKNHTIYYVYKDGSRPTAIVTTTPEQSPIVIDVFEDNIYWLTNKSNELLTMNKFGKGNITVLQKDLINQTSLKVYHKRKMEKNIRKSGLYCTEHCSHLCLHIPRGYSCTCPDGNMLVSLMGEIVCDNQQEDPADDPLDCNCNDTKRICSSTSPYRYCSCKTDCPDGSHHVPYIEDENNLQVYFSATSFIIITVSSILVLVCVTLSCFKRSS